MTRNQAIGEARMAAARAKNLAAYTESAAQSGDPNHYARTERLAAAGALWADTARAYATLAQALPEPAEADDDTQEA
ncbi:hypothetical protein ACYF6T_21255 [Streptomyces sp. 7R007]